MHNNQRPGYNLQFIVRIKILMVMVIHTLKYQLDKMYNLHVGLYNCL